MRPFAGMGINLCHAFFKVHFSSDYSFGMADSKHWTNKSCFASVGDDTGFSGGMMQHGIHFVIIQTKEALVVAITI
jgi:hypothetical protein